MLRAKPLPRAVRYGAALAASAAVVSAVMALSTARGDQRALEPR
jgi:hypothetical protein